MLALPYVCFVEFERQRLKASLLMKLLRNSKKFRHNGCIGWRDHFAWYFNVLILCEQTVCQIGICFWFKQRAALIFVFKNCWPINDIFIGQQNYIATAVNLLVVLYRKNWKIRFEAQMISKKRLINLIYERSLPFAWSFYLEAWKVK